jgi:pilus assembly protein CpaB
MNVKTVIPLALAIVLGLFAAMAAKNMIDKNKNQPAASALHYTQVVVVKDNIAAGSELRAEDLTVGKMAGDIPAEVVYGNPAEVVGRVLTCALVKGQPIMEPVLAPKGTGSGLQSLIPPGMRAITLEVNEFSAVGGFLVPGCHVDVLATVAVADKNNEPFTRIVVQDLKVAAINSHLTPAGPGAEPEGMRSVTLLATPKEAEEINLAAGKGTPRFVLRPSKDDTLTPTDGITLAELMGQAHKSDPFADTKQAAATQPADAAAAWNASHTRTIEAIRGGVESAISVQTTARNTSNQMTDTHEEQKSATEGN